MSATLPAAAKNHSVFTLEIPRGALERCSEKFPEGVNVLIVPPQDMQPELIRLPKLGCDDNDQPYRCPVTGLSRTTLIELLTQAGSKKIPVRHLRKRGATSGITLIPRQKLIDYINEQPAPDWQPEKGEEEE